MVEGPVTQIEIQSDMILQREPYTRWRKIGLFTFLSIPLIIGIVFGVSWIAASALTNPFTEEITYTPKKYNISFNEVSFQSKEGGLSLKGWTFLADQPTNKWIILSHGYSRNRTIWKEPEQLHFFEMLRSKGYNVLTFDYRNSGESEGTLTTVGYFEKQDLLGAIDYVKGQNENANIGLIGWSQGAATSLLAAADFSGVAFVVADSSFHELEEYITTNLPHWSYLPSVPFTPIILSMITRNTGLDMKDVSPIKAIEDIHAPILLIHSKDDQAIPVESSIRMYEQYKDKKNIKFIPFEKADHINSYVNEPENYEAVLNKFFKEIQF